MGGTESDESAALLVDPRAAVYIWPMTIDLGAAYRSARERITTLVAEADPAVVVPATPEWNVHDVVAHLAGIVEDVRTGNMQGVTTDPWTAAQVERGRSKSVAQLLAEWTEGAPMIEGFLSSPAGASAARAVYDVHTHEADLCHALGVPATLPADVVEWSAAGLLADFHAAAEAAGLPAVTVDVSPFEALRGRLGRRTEAEVCAYGWSADPQPYLDSWFVFGRRTEPLGEVEA
jgi:uncharacterized protein (TIGR03083 family)